MRRQRRPRIVSVRRPLVGERRAGEILQALFGDLAGLHRVDLLDLGRQRLAEQLIEPAREIEPQTAALGEPEQRPQQIDLGRIGLDRARPYVERADGIARQRLVDLGERGPVGAVIGACKREPALVDANQARGIAICAVHPLEDRRDRLGILIADEQALSAARAPAWARASRARAGGSPHRIAGARLDQAGARAGGRRGPWC